MLNCLLERELSTSSFSSAGTMRAYRHHSVKEINVWKIGDHKINSANATITEMIIAEEFLLVLAESGICSIINSRTSAIIGMLNRFEEELIFKVFFNPRNQTIVLVSANKDDKTSTLSCHSFQIKSFRNNPPSIVGTPILESETIRWPGFIEFDQPNQRLLTFNPISNIYKIWDLNTLKPLIKFTEQNISDVILSFEIVTIVFERISKKVMFKFLSVTQGNELLQFQMELKNESEFELMEQHWDKLFLKQKASNLLIRNILSGSTIEIEESELGINPNYFFIPECQRILILDKGVVFLFTSEFAKLICFQTRWISRKHLKHIRVSNRFDLLFSLNGIEGCIDISDLRNGIILQKIALSSTKGQICCVAYCEITSTIFVATTSGTIHMFRN